MNGALPPEWHRSVRLESLHNLEGKLKVMPQSWSALRRDEQQPFNVVYQCASRVLGDKACLPELSGLINHMVSESQFQEVLRSPVLGGSDEALAPREILAEQTAIRRISANAIIAKMLNYHFDVAAKAASGAVPFHRHMIEAEILNLKREVPGPVCLEKPSTSMALAFKTLERLRFIQTPEFIKLSELPSSYRSFVYTELRSYKEVHQWAQDSHVQTSVPDRWMHEILRKEAYHTRCDTSDRPFLEQQTGMARLASNRLLFDIGHKILADAYHEGRNTPGLETWHSHMRGDYHLALMELPRRPDCAPVDVLHEKVKRILGDLAAKVAYYRQIAENNQAFQRRAKLFHV